MDKNKQAKKRKISSRIDRRLSLLVAFISLFVPIIYAAHIYTIIPWETPLVIPMPHGDLEIPIEASGETIVGFFLALFGLLLIGMIIYASLYAKKQYQILKGAIAFCTIGCCFLCVGALTPLTYFKEKQFETIPQSHILRLDPLSIDIPINLIKGSIAPFQYSTKEYMYRNNKSFISIPWKHITTWHVVRIKTGGVRGGSRIPVYKLYCDQRFTNETGLQSITIDRYPLQGYEAEILNYANAHLNNPPVISDKLLD